MTPVHGRLRIVDCGPQAQLADLAAAVRAGLTAPDKRLPCRLFYDAAGSALFEEICALPEYYLTRAEDEILRARAVEIAAAVPPGATVVELGSGRATKTRLLLDAALRRAPAVRYVAIDISRPALEDSARGLLGDHPGLSILAIAAEYDEGLRLLADVGAEPKLMLWLGSNVGNLDRAAAARFLAQLRAAMGPEDRFVLGVDLRKDRTVLERAYDDAQGVTARFNLNLLARLNRELGAAFDLSAFAHRAHYDDAAGRIEMYLVSTRPQRVALGRLGIDVDFDAGEAIHTEDSYKYSAPEIDALARAAGFAVERRWSDARHRFSVNLLAPRP